MPKPLQISANQKHLTVPANEDALFEALAKGDTATAEAVLEEIPALNKSSIELLGQLMGSTDVAGFPYKLKLMRRRAGKPSDPMVTGSRDFMVAHAVKTYQAQKVKKEAAIADAMKLFKVKRATVLAALKRWPSK